MEFEKISNNEIKVAKQEIKNEETVYEYSYLLSQRENIIKDRDDYIILRNTEIAEINIILAECAKLGIVANIEVEKIIKEVI